MIDFVKWGAICAYYIASKWNGTGFELMFTMCFDFWINRTLIFAAKVSRAQFSADYSSVWWIPNEKPWFYIKIERVIPGDPGATLILESLNSTWERVWKRVWEKPATEGPGTGIVKDQVRTPKASLFDEKGSGFS